MRDGTIFAVSSGAPPAAIAIIRISGSSAFSVARILAGTLPVPRRPGVRALRDPADDSLLDRALVLTFEAPRSATGEDVVELHVHGGRAVVSAVETALDRFPDTRRAEAGEFTRRALENGVIDLTAAEGLADLLAAQTETQRRAAVQMSEGGLRALIDAWTVQLIKLAAIVEAQLDFSDEDDVPSAALEHVIAEIRTVADEIGALLEAPPIERLHEGIRVVIGGPPNSGKSTLLNALADRDVAIVSDISGTTRDRVEAPVTRNGIAYVLTDTAGLTDQPSDEIERIGISRAHDALDAADIILWLGEIVDAPTRAIRVYPRNDLPERHSPPIDSDVSLSASSGAGLRRLWTLIEDRSKGLLPKESQLAINGRQRDILVTCHGALQACEVGSLLVVSEELRVSLRGFDRVTGRAGVEDVLDSIFGSFCIGK